MNAQREPYRNDSMKRSKGSKRSSEQSSDVSDGSANLGQWKMIAPIWIVSDGQHSNNENIDENNDILIEDGYDWLR
jgi:hypothetical protein